MSKLAVFMGFALALGGVVNVARAGEGAAGELAYAQHCKECHRSAALLAKEARGATPEARAAWILSFIERHHAPDPAVRRAIAAYLSALSQQP